ncbi:MAG: DUF2218 domain-containing protein [Micromonosporaceae bacterium]
MLITEANVLTARPDRYLAQLCQHLAQVARLNPVMRASVEWTQESGTIGFPWATCRLVAGSGMLTLRVESPDETGLRRLRRRVGERLVQIGRRDGLTVAWSTPERVDPRRSRPAGTPVADG